MEIGPLKDGYKVETPQSNSENVPRLPMRVVALGPSSSGKSNLLVTLLTDDRFYKNKFEKIYWISPTARVDPSLDVLREYVKKHLKQDQEEDPTFHDQINIPFLQSKVERQKNVTEYLKKTKSQQGFNMIIILDDLADIKRGLPAVSKFVDSLFVKARHWNVSVILSTQKLKLPLISPTVRVNVTNLFVFRLRNQSDLWDGLIYEYSALVSKELLYAAYKQAVSIPYNFLYIDLLSKDLNHMFFSGFSKRFDMSETAN
jgi:GTPase SAR1 family protein